MTITKTASALLAFAVWKLFPSAKLDGGHADEETFCYDFYLDQPLNDEMLGLIETEMVMIAKEDRFQVKELMRENASDLFNHLGQPCLADMVLEAEWNIVSTLTLEKLYLPFEGEVAYGAFKIQKFQRIEGRTRIYGVAARDKQALKELEKRTVVDHREEAKRLNLYQQHEELPAGSVLWQPEGTFVKKEIEKWFFETHIRQGFQPVESPRIVQEKLLAREQEQAYSYIRYKKGEYPHPEPLHDLIFRSGFRSYRDLPLKYAELYESYKPGSHRPGLFSVLPRTCDRGTVYCMEEQVVEELISSLQFMGKIIKMFDFKPRATLLVSNQKKDIQFEKWFREALEITNPSYDEERVTDGSAIVLKPAGMRIDLQYGRRLQYQGADDAMHKPVVLRRTLFGSVERLLAYILENRGGTLPLWLTPQQVRVLSIKEGDTSYAAEVQQRLRAEGVRAEVDSRNETLAAKIHAAEIDRVPVIIAVGSKEAQTETVALRDKGQVQKGVKLETVIEQLRKNIGREFES